MKVLIVMSVLCVVLYSNEVSAGLRVVRDDGTKEAVPDFGKILAGAMKRLRAKATDPQLQADLDKVQTALDDGSLKESLDKVKMDLGTERFDLQKVIASLKANAPPELMAEVDRITTAAKGALEKIHDRVHQHAGRLDERLKAAADEIAAARA